MVSSVYFDGTGDYLSVANNAALQAGTGNFTLDAWIYRSAAGSAHTIYAKGGSSTGMNFQVTSANVLRFTYATSNIDSTGTIPATSWTHVAVVREGTGSNQTKLYINGVNDGQGTVSTDFNQTEESRVGTNRDAGENFNGYMSNVRFTKGTALYTATFVPPPLPLLSNFNYIAYPSLLLRGAGTNGSTTFTDSSPNAFTVTAFGNAQISTAQAPTGMSSSMYFDGTGDYLTISDNEAWDFGTGNFTVEAWVYPQGSAANQRIYSQYNTFANQVSLRRNDTNNVQFFVVSSSATLVNLTTTATLNINAWNQVAIVRNGNVFTIYLNGVPAATSTASITYPNVASSLFISTYDGVNEGWNGYISNIRFIKGTALYRSNFTPPVLPLSATPETNLTPSTTASTITNNVYGVYQLA
jgi:hypothetical protein